MPLLSNFLLQNWSNLVSGNQIFLRLHKPNSSLFQFFVTFRLIEAEYTFALWPNDPFLHGFLQLVSDNFSASERKYLRTHLMWLLVFWLNEIKDMRKRSPQVLFCKKSTELFSSASEQSSRQCLHKIKIDKDFTYSYWQALQFVHQ